MSKFQPFIEFMFRMIIDAGLIRYHDDTVGSRARKYLPCWV